MNRSLLALLILGGCTAGSGPGDDGDDDDTPPPTDLECPTEGRFMELTPGATWTYRVDDGEEITEKTQTVGALEDIGGSKAGTMAYRLTTNKPGGGQTISWQEDTGTSILRHRELDQSGGTQTDEIYEPYKLRVDESADHLNAGAAWTETYQEIVTDSENVTTTADKTEAWEVVAFDEMISVEAGEFCTLHVQRMSSTGGAGGSLKHYWFARGVGKVKESGDNQTEELLSYSLD
jgi:hypothetical protein